MLCKNLSVCLKLIIIQKIDEEDREMDDLMADTDSKYYSAAAWNNPSASVVSGLSLLTSASTVSSELYSKSTAMSTTTLPTRVSGSVSILQSLGAASAIQNGSNVKTQEIINKETSFRKHDRLSLPSSSVSKELEQNAGEV